MSQLNQMPPRESYPADKVFFHGTAQTFTEFILGDGNAGEGVYLTDHPKAAEYYSCFATKDLAIREKGIQAIMEPRRVGMVRLVRVNPTAKIKHFNSFPEYYLILRAKKEGYDGISYPDEMLNSCGDWDRKLLGQIPQDTRATVMFKPADAIIIS